MKSCDVSWSKFRMSAPLSVHLFNSKPNQNTLLGRFMFFYTYPCYGSVIFSIFLKKLSVVKECYANKML